MTTNTISPLRQRMIEDMSARKLTAGRRASLAGCLTKRGWPRRGTWWRA